MAMEEEPATSTANAQSLTCEECKTKTSKYKCPGCSLRTCSLPCVNSHKQRTACTGKKPMDNVVSLSQFDDNIILSDYNMLEDVKRMAESSQRTRVKLCGNYHFRLPFPLKSLQNAASKRRTRILFHSHGMSKREMNRTYYNKRKKFISWTIEWRFHSTNVVKVDHGVHENKNLGSVIQNHLKPGPWNHSLRQFSEATLDSLKIFIRKNPKGAKSPYCQLNIEAPIREQLVNIVVLEYPVIYVFLPSHICDFEVIVNLTPVKAEILKSACTDIPSPKGVTFKEEEIEESSDPPISDLGSNAYENLESKKKSDYLMQCPVDERAVKCPRLFTQSDHGWSRSMTQSDDAWVTTVAQSHASSGPTTENYAGSDYRTMTLTDYELEPGFLDVFSDLIGETNVDNMLENLEVETFLLDEELEEGEIA